MIKYELVPNTVTINYETECQSNLQLRPIEIDENYFDKLVRFGGACIISGLVGKFVMSSLSR